MFFLYRPYALTFVRSRYSLANAPISKKTVNIDGFIITIDQTCFANINNSIEQDNQEFKQAPNNYLKGFLGVLVGGVAGFALSFVLYLCGFISAISAFVSVALGAFLYKKFGGKQNKMMVVIVAFTTLACMVLSIFGVYIMSAGIASAEVGAGLNAFEAFAVCIKDKEFSGMFYTDLALSVVFSIVGIVWQAITLFKQIKRPTKLQ